MLINLPWKGVKHNTLFQFPISGYLALHPLMEPIPLAAIGRVSFMTAPGMHIQQLDQASLH